MTELKPSAKKGVRVSPAEVSATTSKGVPMKGGKGSVSKSVTSPSSSSPSSSSSSASSSLSTSSVIYFLGVPRKNDPTVRSGLQKVYGIGRASARSMCHALGLMPSVPFSRVSREEFQTLEQYVTDHRRVESDLRRRETEKVARHRSLGSVRGIRMRLGLPVRGQRTKSNAKTAKRLNRTRGS